MQAPTYVLGDLKLCVVLTETQSHLCATHNLLGFAPDADVRIGAAPRASPDRIGDLVHWATAMFVGRPDLATEPVAARPLEAARIDADLILDLRPGPPDPALEAIARFGVWTIMPFDSSAVLRGEACAMVGFMSQAPDGSQGLVAEACVQTKWLPGHTEAFALEKSSTI